MKPRIVSIRTSLTLSLVLAALTGCGDQQQAGPGGKGKARVLEPIKVSQTAQSVPATTRPTIRITGTLYAMEDVIVSAKVPGRIVALKHDLGDRVAPDKPLAEIDRVDYDLAVKEREMAVSAVLAKLGLAAFPSAQFKADEVPTVRSSALQLTNVSGKYDRLKKLFEQTPPLISEQEFADARTLFEVARAEYQVQLLNAKALLAEAQTRQAELNVASQRLADTTIRAPLATSTSAAQEQANPLLSYAIAQRLVSVGEYVREGTPLFRLIDDDPVKMRAMVPERHAGLVDQNMSVTVRVQAHRDSFTGVISRVSPQVDPLSRTFTVEVLIPNPKGLLKPGAFASAVIVLPTEKTVVSVPLDAVTSFAGIHKVFTIGPDGKAKENRVELGDRDDKNVLLLSGLAPGEKVILAPPAQMVGGTPLILPK